MQQLAVPFFDSFGAGLNPSRLLVLLLDIVDTSLLDWYPELLYEVAVPCSHCQALGVCDEEHCKCLSSLLVVALATAFLRCAQC